MIKKHGVRISVTKYIYIMMLAFVLLKYISGILEFLPDKISSKKIYLVHHNTKKNCLEELYLLFTTCNHRLGSGLNLITCCIYNIKVNNNITIAFITHRLESLALKMIGSSNRSIKTAGGRL